MSIAHLSNDALYYVFSDLCASGHTATHGIPVLLAVCRRWRTLVFGCASLWTTVNSVIAFNKTLTRYALLLSRRLPVEIIYVVDSPTTSINMPLVIQFRLLMRPTSFCGI